MSDLLRMAITALLPSGSAWRVKDDGDLDKILEAVAEQLHEYVDSSAELAHIRDPFTTPILSDLEREYGIGADSNLTMSERRQILASQVFSGTSNGSADTLQNALQLAGFNVQVHENSPAVDVNNFLNNVFLMVAGGDNAFAGFFPTTPGDFTSVAGKTGGSLLVNGQAFEQSPLYEGAAGNVYAGSAPLNRSGYFIKLRQDPIFYPIPSDPDAWPFVFFVGGDATRNAQGELTAIDIVDIPLERQIAFERIILRYKPMHTWAGLMVNYN